MLNLDGCQVEVSKEQRRQTVKSEYAELSAVIDRTNNLSERVWRGICAGEAPNTNLSDAVDLPSALAQLREKAAITMLRLETIIDVLGVE